MSYNYDPWFENLPIDDYFLRLYPKDHPEWDMSHFGDEPHHMGYIVTADFHMEDTRYLNRLIKGVEQRKFGEWVKSDSKGNIYRKVRTTYYRQPFIEINEYLNRDQITPLIYPLSIVRPDLAKDVYKSVHEVYFPHQWMHFQRSLGRKWIYPIRLFCDVFETLDILADIFMFKIGKLSNSSAIKNVFRQYVAKKRHPTFLSNLNFKLLDKCLDLKQVFYNYWTGPFPLQAPIYKSWYPIIDWLRTS